MKNNKNNNENKKDKEALNSDVNEEFELPVEGEESTSALEASDSEESTETAEASEALPLLTPKRVNGSDIAASSTPADDTEDEAVTYGSSADDYSYNSTVSVDKLSLSREEDEPVTDEEAESEAETSTDTDVDSSTSEESYKEVTLDSHESKMPNDGFEIKPDFVAAKPSPLADLELENTLEDEELVQPDFDLDEETDSDFKETVETWESAEKTAEESTEETATAPATKPNYFANFRKNISREYQNSKANRQTRKAAEKAEEARNPRMRALKQARRQRGAAGTLLLLSAFATLFIRLFWANQETEFLGVNRMNLDGAFFLELVIQLLAIMLPSLLIYLAYKLNPHAIIGRSKQNRTSYALTALTGLLLAVGSIGVHNLNLFLLDRLNLNPSYTNWYNINEQPSVWGVLLIVLVLAVVPALTEEFMFRGVIQSALASSSKLHLSILFTATASALFEGNFSFILVPLAVAIYLSYAKARSDNLLISVLMHFVYKLGLIVLQPVMPMFSSSIDLHGSDGQSAFYTSLIFAIVAIIVLFPLSKALFKSYSENAEKVVEEPIKRRRLSQEQWFPVDWKYLLALIIIFIGANIR